MIEIGCWAKSTMLHFTLLINLSVVVYNAFIQR